MSDSPQRSDADYFQGYTKDEPHPHMPATGTEGRCELCGLGPDASVHIAADGRSDTRRLRQRLADAWDTFNGER